MGKLSSCLQTDGTVGVNVYDPVAGTTAARVSYPHVYTDGTVGVNVYDPVTGTTAARVSYPHVYRQTGQSVSMSMIL